MEIKELGHLVLYVRNLDRSASFYRDVLGWRQIIGGPGDSPLPFRAAGLYIDVPGIDWRNDPSLAAPVKPLRL